MGIPVKEMGLHTFNSMDHSDPEAQTLPLWMKQGQLLPFLDFSL